MDISFHNALRVGFLDLAKEDPNRFCVFDAACSVEELHEHIRHVVQRRFGL